MGLVKSTLQKSIYDGLYRIFINQSNKAINGDEKEKPEDVIKQVADEMATVISNAVDEFVRSGDITVSAANIQVTSSTPGSPATVASLQPAKMN